MKIKPSFDQVLFQVLAYLVVGGIGFVTLFPFLVLLGSSFASEHEIITSGYNRHFKTEDRHEWTYQIVNGKIVTDDPGRPGKTIDYAVYKKEGDELILKGGIEGFYFFKKQ